MTYKSRSDAHVGAIVDRYQLGSNMWHLQLDAPILHSSIGDCVAIWPCNNESNIARALSFFQLRPDDRMTIGAWTGTAGAFFREQVELTRITPMLRQAMYDALHQDDILTIPATDPIALLSAYYKHGDFALMSSWLTGLRPRLYSIASSPSTGCIELMVSRVWDQEANTEGVCSSYLSVYAPLHTKEVRYFVQPTRHRLALDRSLIMIATGSGMAPFRAYMQEAPETLPTWLFFGEKHAANWYYRPFWEETAHMKQFRMTTAFSRDQEQKIYVQHRLWEHRYEVWAWIEQGAAVMLCGNAKTMAPAVDACWLAIAKEMGHYSDDQAVAWLSDLKQQHRYVKDVY